VIAVPTLIAAVSGVGHTWALAVGPSEHLWQPSPRSSRVAARTEFVCESRECASIVQSRTASAGVSGRARIDIRRSDGKGCGAARKSALIHRLSSVASPQLSLSWLRNSCQRFIGQHETRCGEVTGFAQDRRPAQTGDDLHVEDLLNDA
jgi:hypothetical protein